MSCGIPEASEFALAVGASTCPKKIPVRFVKRKTEIRARGANLIERNWGIFLGNFIQMFSNVHDYQVSPGDCSASPDVIGVALLWKESREVQSLPRLRWRNYCNGCLFLE